MNIHNTLNIYVLWTLVAIIMMNYAAIFFYSLMPLFLGDYRGGRKVVQ